MNRYTSGIDHLAYAFDKLKISRRVGFYFTLWMTWLSVTHSFDFVHVALDTNKPPLEIAAVIAAILVPVTGLQGAVIGLHHWNRDTHNRPPHREVRSHSDFSS